MAKKQDKNFLFKICELLATIGILGNTLILIIFQNTWTYEKLPILKFEPTPKSSYLTIIQHNPIFAIIYILCGLVLLMCAIYRLLSAAFRTPAACLKPDRGELKLERNAECKKACSSLA